VLVLHWPVVWPFFRWRPGSFNFFALSIGSVIPDLECPFLFPFASDRWHARGPMHSLLGAATFDLVLAVLLALYFVPMLLGWLDRRVKDKRYFAFAGVDLRGHRTTTAAAVGSALLGTVSHVLLDVLHHPFNPLTFPFSQYYGFNLVLFGDLTLSGIIVQGTTLSALLLMLYFWYLRPLRSAPEKGRAQ